MKHCLILIFIFLSFISHAQPAKTQNVFIVTIDGIRWQEIFKGPDPNIISNRRFTDNIELVKLMYLDTSFEQSRKKLLPFFWNVIQNEGQLYGNRMYKNKVNVSNTYKFSYPGYNEILTGYADMHVNSNNPVDNLNINVLEYLDSFDEFRNRVVAFTSWEIFPYILNKKRNGLMINSGYDTLEEKGNLALHMFNKAQENLSEEKSTTRTDAFTFIAASEYIKVNKPRIVYMSFGDCDDDAHRGEYDKYLEHLNGVDRMIQQLWYFIQSTPGYKNKTTLLITTDHGRGKKENKWTEHDILVKGSGDAWLAVIGPDTKPEGEIQLPRQLYQKQLAATISSFLGHNFTANHPVAKSIDFGNHDN